LHHIKFILLKMVTLKRSQVATLLNIAVMFRIELGLEP